MMVEYCRDQNCKSVIEIKGIDLQFYWKVLKRVESQISTHILKTNAHISILRFLGIFRLMCDRNGIHKGV